MILQTIDTINERITGQLATDNHQIVGIAVPFYDQQEKATSLMLVDEKRRLSMDDKRLWQSVHLTDGSSVTSKKTWGSFSETVHDVRFVLTGLSKAPHGLDLAMRAVQGIGYVVIDDYDDKTLPVLQRYWQVRPGQEKNYDPGLYAFAIRYHIVGVSDEDYAELPDAAELAVLPVKVPEAAPGVPDPTIPAEQGERVINETPIGAVNGSNATYQSLLDFIPESVEVFVSGFRLTQLDDFNTAGTKIITLFDSPLPGERIRINYQKQL